MRIYLLDGLISCIVTLSPSVKPQITKDYIVNIPVGHCKQIFNFNRAITDYLFNRSRAVLFSSCCNRLASAILGAAIVCFGLDLCTYENYVHKLNRKFIEWGFSR